MTNTITLTREEVEKAREECVRFLKQHSRCFWRWNIECAAPPDNEPRCHLYESCKKLTQFVLQESPKGRKGGEDGY